MWKPSFHKNCEKIKQSLIVAYSFGNDFARKTFLSEIHSSKPERNFLLPFQPYIEASPQWRVPGPCAIHPLPHPLQLPPSQTALLSLPLLLFSSNIKS